MPPKKKPDKKNEPDEEPAGYNIALMSLDQLKQYARLLEGEIEDMRKHCNFYQKMEDELVEMLRLTEDDLRCSEESILSKDVEMEKMKLKFLKQIKEKRQWPKYMEHSGSVMAEQLSNETCNRLEQEETRHQQETKRLKQILQEKDRQLEILKIKIEMAKRETQERNEKYMKEVDDDQKGLMDEAIRRFNTVMKEAERSFAEAKETMECEAREGKIRGERSFNDACEAFKRKLHNYYKEVTKQDLDTIKKLKQEIKKIGGNIERSKLLLKEAEEVNKHLQETNKGKLPKRGSLDLLAKHSTSPLKMLKALNIHNRTEKLTLENQNLEDEIKNVTESTYNLRRQFTLALKRVRDSAEMKASFLEKKLNFIMEENRNQSSSSVTEGETEITGHESSEQDAPVVTENS